MRITIDIDDDVLVAAEGLAAAGKITVGRLLSDLARQGLTHPTLGLLTYRNGFVVLPKRGGVVTPELIDRLAEDDL